MPIFTASAPASISACAPSAVATLPAIDLHGVGMRLIALDRRPARRREWPCAVSTTITSTSASISASTRAEAVLADAGRGGDAQAALLVLAGVRMGLRLLHVLDGDQADAAIGVVDHQQLLDPVAVQQAPGLVRRDVGRHGDQVVVGHQLVDPACSGRWRSGRRGWSGCRPACRCRARPPGCRRCWCWSSVARTSARVWSGWMVTGFTTMPRFELLDLADLVGLLLGVEVLVDDADAAGLGHGDGHGRLGHGVHRRGDQRDAQLDARG